MNFILMVINGHDYSAYVDSEGYEWVRDDLDSEDTIRVKTGNMRRHKINEKQNPPIKMRTMPHQLVKQLDDDLRQNTFRATIFTPHDQRQGEFYCSSFKCRLNQVTDINHITWSDISFTLHEV